MIKFWTNPLRNLYFRFVVATIAALIPASGMAQQYVGQYHALKGQSSVALRIKFDEGIPSDFAAIRKYIGEALKSSQIQLLPETFPQLNFVVNSMTVNSLDYRFSGFCFTFRMYFAQIIPYPPAAAKTEMINATTWEATGKMGFTSTPAVFGQNLKEVLKNMLAEFTADYKKANADSN